MYLVRCSSPERISRHARNLRRTVRASNAQPPKDYCNDVGARPTTPGCTADRGGKDDTRFAGKRIPGRCKDVGHAKPGGLQIEPIERRLQMSVVQRIGTQHHARYLEKNPPAVWPFSVLTTKPEQRSASPAGMTKAAQRHNIFSLSEDRK